MRRVVEEHTQTPTNWCSYLRIDQIKTKLFTFLSRKIMQIETNKIAGAAFDDEVLYLNNENCMYVVWKS